MPKGRPFVGQLIKSARLAARLTQAELGGAELGALAISAIERGAVVPSNPTLELIAQRLGLQYEALAAASRVLRCAVDLHAVVQDLAYTDKSALDLIRNGQATKALLFIEDLDLNHGPYLAALAPEVRYRLAFLRGRAYYARSEYGAAQTHLQQALRLAAPHKESLLRVRNLLGATLFQLEQQADGRALHDECVSDIAAGVTSDRSLIVSVWSNLAHDHWALGNPVMAISAYNSALAVLEDMHELERQASIRWGLMMVYRAQGMLGKALIQGREAITIYAKNKQTTHGAAICLNLAEIMLDEGRYKDAAALLKQAERLLSNVHHPGLYSFLYADSAELELREGRLDLARQFADRSVYFADLNRRIAAGEIVQPMVHPVRTHVSALHITGLVEEARGNREAAEMFIGSAIEEIKKTSFEEAAQQLQLSYAKMLLERGEHERSSDYYRSLAQGLQRR